MVKGRRVRAVVPCPENDDCCSPNPKRKDQKVEKTQMITEFFQTVVQMEYNGGMIDEKTEKFEKCVLKETKFSDLNTTKDGFDRKAETRAPSTPHRIEYRMEPAVAPGSEQEQIVPVAEKQPPPPRGRRRPRHAAEADGSNTKLTEFFPVRRSVRKTKRTVLEEKQRSIEWAVRDGTEDGLAVRAFDGKGRGVVAARPFDKGDFVVEYSGELIDIAEAKRREYEYSLDQTAGCYMYYFKHKSQQYCIDATAETGRFGRLVNHSRNGNLVTRTVLVDNKPRLVLIAKDRILPGEEISYDYGDRSKESLKHHPWLAF